jgi:hypothetical protein
LRYRIAAGESTVTGHTTTTTALVGGKEAAVGLTAAHWVYLAGVVLILGVTIARKNVLVPALLATAVTAWVLTGNVITGIQAIFNASLTAAAELFDIFLIIAMVTALLGSLRAMKADQRMVTPFQRIMRGGWSAYLVLAVATYGISLFFWPTPAVPLIGAILVPAAIRAGLPAIGAAMAMAVAGQGMALSSDYVMQVAPGLSATAARVRTSDVADVALLLSLITGVTALVITAVLLRRQMRAPSAANLEEWEAGVVTIAKPARTLWSRVGISISPTRRLVAAQVREPEADVADLEDRVAVGAGVGGGAPRVGGAENRPPNAGANTGAPRDTGALADGGAPDLGDSVTSAAVEDDERTVLLSKIFSVAVPCAFLLMIGYLVLGKFTHLVPPLQGGSAAALVGGIAALLVVLAVVALEGPKRALSSVGEHMTDGLVFAFRAMGVVLPIAGFFFLGNAEFAGQVLGYPPGQRAPGLLVDLVTSTERFVHGNPVVLCFGMLIIGMMCGLEGSGFSGLPLTGSLAGALGPSAGVHSATLAAVGQLGSVWAGGGVLVAWSSLLVVAGVTRVPVIELARRCFFPVLVGLVLATLFAALFL